jgi:hypothetical protein
MAPGLIRKILDKTMVKGGAAYWDRFVKPEVAAENQEKRKIFFQKLKDRASGEKIGLTFEQARQRGNRFSPK